MSTFHGNTMNQLKVVAEENGFQASGFYREKWTDPTDRGKYIDIGYSSNEVRLRFHVKGKQVASYDVRGTQHLDHALLMVRGFCNGELRFTRRGKERWT